METYIRNLEAVGQCQESYGNLLVSVVLEKVSGEICRQIARENSVNNWELGDLRRAINREIGILEASTTHSDPGIDDSVARASFHTGTRPGKRA